ncbi:CzcA family heavy metal efflux pump/hydrophobe/amphiphile efflux-1 (HAE1) family protein [Pseudoduganella flava]|uniref:AcrB/AcrD/AcrF family protein n=1 Tax=Pseudoduganella flava TaxID=871742 RepID=A0A562PWM9_9BURK|nr:efflux RND transporter permease subunit [Pseudoduganella flava]QGZ39599.1 AcrB/AcrD/AcrF family protein [Pseudoduganella flava]TWI48496.1 CzcA family heavy metal efflux pump/hydrophobe/amphiphile efflux-1 (HAE1) family protein [Pseudoduganella flava]
MWITKISIRQPVFAAMVMVGLMVLGLFSYRGLGVESMPNVELPFAAVEVIYPGAAPEAVENDITRPLEDMLNTVSGVKTIRANSWEGKAGVYLEFQLATNMDRAMQDVRDKVSQVRPRFPKEAKDPLVLRIEGDNAQPVANLTLTSTGTDLRTLSTLTEQLIIKRLQGVAGVGQVRTFGTTQRQVLVNLRPADMTAQGVGVNEVMKAIADTNADLPAGNITRDAADRLVRVEGKLKDPREFNRIIVARRANGPVYLEQVATVTDGQAEETSIARVNGQRGISLEVTKVQDANVVAVGEGVKAAVAELRGVLPPDVVLKVVDAQSDRVQSQLDNVKRTIVEGAVLTMVIVFFFLHSWRSTVITGLTLPISVLASFIAMKAFGFTLNFLTLMALSLCIGLLIDDAIVVRENIVRHLGFGKHHREAAEDGTNEIGVAVMATTFAIVAVFVPVAFMDGLIGRFFLQFGITVTVAVLVSLFVSFTLDPMLSSVWPDPVEGRFRYVPMLGRLMARIEHGIEAVHGHYGRLLALALRWRKSTLALTVALFAASLLLLPKIGGEMFPETDQGWINLVFKVPVGSSLEYNASKVAQVEAALKEFPEIDNVFANIGTPEGRHISYLNVKLTDPKKTHRRSQQQVEKAIRERLASIPGITPSVGQKPIFIAILGTDEAKLDAVAHDLMDRMRKIRGVADLEYSQEGANPSTSIRIRPELASDLGLTVQQIGAALRPFVAGETVGHWLAPDGQNYEINVQLPKAGRQRVADLADLSLASSRLGPDGKPLMVPLRQVVEFVPSSSPQVLKRQALMRRVAVFAAVEGRPGGDVDADVKRAMDAIALPPGVRFDVGGNAKEMQETMTGALTAVAIAIVFIYLVLASQFGSFLQPVAIMVSLPLSLIGVLVALLVTGSTLNIFSVIGVIMLMGLVTKNAILLVDFTNHAQRAGQDQRAALMAAGQVRLRPILMTTLAMVFGMLPMAIGLGDGGETQAPMGRAVIGGVITSTLLTLVVVPVAYTYLDNLGRRAARWFTAGRTVAAAT